MKKTEMTFDSAMKKLEDAAAMLRSGELSLEESIKVYEDSIKYYDFCSKFLSDTRQKIEIYRPESGKTEDFGGLQ